jgi:ATP-dependent Clp protease, protease subunit
MMKAMDFLPNQLWLRDRDDSPEKEEKKEKEPKYKLEEKFLETRTILLFGEITQKVAREVCEKLILLSALNDNDIKVIINSQGGHVEAGDTIHDMLTFVKPKVKILGTGWVASAGALIFVAVPTENRYSLPNTRFMLHQPSGGVGGQASDISIEAQEILKMRDRLNKIFSVQTGQPVERIERDTDRNFWMSADEAKAYGLVGKVITSQADF